MPDYLKTNVETQKSTITDQLKLSTGCPNKVVPSGRGLRGSTQCFL